VPADSRNNNKLRPQPIAFVASAFLLLLTLSISPAPFAAETEVVTVDADVWGDNWFAVYIGDKLVVEDSVPYNTERSFNSESASFDVTLPANVNVIMKDFKENDSGLEYIGTRRVQIGDGGFIAQFFDAESGELIAASDESWRCLVIHRAPLNRSCVQSSEPEHSCQSEIVAEPEGWMQPGFDDSEWPHAIVHSARAVQPRRGYDRVTWDDTAKLIWGEDLEIDNTVLCRFQIPAN